MKEYKVIEREYIDPVDRVRKTSRFVAEGIWGNGHLAYSRIGDDDEIDYDERGAYYQIRENGKMLMVRV